MSEDAQGQHGPEFSKLVVDLRTLKVEKARRNADGVMRKALDLQRAGKLTAADIARLQAARMRAEGGR